MQLRVNFADIPKKGTSNAHPVGNKTGPPQPGGRICFALAISSSGGQLTRQPSGSRKSHIEGSRRTTSSPSWAWWVYVSELHQHAGGLANAQTLSLLELVICE